CRCVTGTPPPGATTSSIRVASSSMQRTRPHSEVTGLWRTVPTGSGAVGFLTIMAIRSPPAASLGTRGSPRSTPSSTITPRMSLNGRDHELAVLTEALAGLADAPETRVVTIVGEPGIGKSALLGALSTLADDAGVRLLQARAADHERDVPF